MQQINKWHEAQDSITDWATTHQDLIEANPELKAEKVTRIPQGLEYQGHVVPGRYPHIPKGNERMGMLGSLERWILEMIRP